MRHQPLLSTIFLTAALGCGDKEPFSPGNTTDADGDGFSGSDDCDDNDAAVNPDADEICDGIDNNCDEVIDEETAIDALIWYADTDADGFGDDSTPTTACEQPSGYVEDNTDCDDTTADVNPEAVETCDGVDNNCDTIVDEDTAVDALIWYADTDADGFGDDSSPANACAQPSGYVEDNTDCDDGDTAVNPGAEEICNDIDDNCDTVVDEDTAIDAPIWYADTDTDGFGDDAAVTYSCTQPSGYVEDNTDCDDTAAETNPDVDEVCDGIDNNCDGDTDETTATDAAIWYADTDADGFGDASSTTPSCDQPAGYVSDNTDCDDTASTSNPDASERCDGTDNDCDGDTDEDSAVDASVWYADSDSDSFGDTATSVTTCYAPSGYVSNDDDCDDSNTDINPSADEVCNSEDDDCDGSTDEADAIDATTWYADTDTDGFGDASTSAVSCEQPSGYVDDDTDCDDTDSTINPDGAEFCNGVDDDCDGLVPSDETDVDGDGLLDCVVDLEGLYVGDASFTLSVTIGGFGSDTCVGGVGDVDISLTSGVAAGSLQCLWSGAFGAAFGSTTMNTGISGTVDSTGALDLTLDDFGSTACTGYTDGTTMALDVSDSFSYMGSPTTVTGSMTLAR